MTSDTDNSIYEPLIKAVTSGRAQVILVADPAKSRLFGHRDWSAKKTRQEMIKNGEFRAYVSFPEKLEPSDPLFRSILSQKYYWNTLETPYEEEGTSEQHYYRIKGDKITKQLPLNAIKHEFYKPGVHRTRFFENLTADHEPVKPPKIKPAKKLETVPEGSSITDDDWVEALRAYEVKFTGICTNLVRDENGVFGGSVSYKIQMRETPSEESSQNIKTLFPRFTNLLDAWKKQKGITIPNKLQEIGSQQLEAKLGGHEVALLKEGLPAMETLLDEADIKPYRIPQEAFVNGAPNQIKFTGGDRKNPQKRTATLFVTQEGDTHYLVVASICPADEMDRCLNRLGLQLPKFDPKFPEDWPFITLDKEGQPTDGHYGKIPIDADIYDDLVSANIPDLESGEVHETIAKLLADAAVIAASKSEAPSREREPGPPPKTLSPEEIAARESKIAEKVAEIALRAAKNSKTEAAYLGAIDDGETIKYFAYVLVPTAKGPSGQIRDGFNAINDEYDFKGDERRGCGVIKDKTYSKSDPYSMLSIPLTEEHYENLRQRGDLFSLLEDEMKGSEAHAPHNSTFMDNEPTRQWLIKKTKEVNAEAQAARE
ncbi:MAG: hypothetical protein ACOYJ2_08505, partial [Rickettsiales bacterium]